MLVVSVALAVLGTVCQSQVSLTCVVTMRRHLVSYKLKTLKGSPVKVYGYFNVEWNELESVEGAPEYVQYGIYLQQNPNLIIPKYFIRAIIQSI